MLPKADLAIIALFCAGLGIFGYGIYRKGRADEFITQSLKQSEQREAQRKRYEQLQKEKDDEQAHYEQLLRGVGDELADALERLRQRPARISAAARTSCQGSSGAELSAEDAAFLTREAARADGLRAALIRCQGGEGEAEGGEH